MNAKERLEKIASIVKLALGQDPEVELANAELQDGSKLEAVSFESGSEVFVVSEDGEKMPLPVGEYVTTEKKKIVVVTEGIIDSIAEAAKEAEEAEKVAEEMSDAPVSREEFNQLVESVSALADGLKLSLENEAKQKAEAEKLAAEKLEAEAKLAKEEKEQEIVHDPESKKVNLSNQVKVSGLSIQDKIFYQINNN